MPPYLLVAVAASPATVIVESSLVSVASTQMSVTGEPPLDTAPQVTKALWSRGVATTEVRASGTVTGTP